jgi:hypothetical protein
MKWPNTIPEDLRKRMDATLSQRTTSSATLWGDVVEWLIKHDVPAPDHPLPEAEEIQGKTGH